MPNVPYQPSGLKIEDMQLICKLLREEDEKYRRTRKVEEGQEPKPYSEEVIYNRVQKVLGIPLDTILEADVIFNGKNKITPDGLGPVELRPYIVAVRCRTSNTWDNEEPNLKEARERYDRGEVEMFTRVDGMNIIVYSKPLSKKDKYRFAYFSETEEDNDDAN